MMTKSGLHFADSTDIDMQNPNEGAVPTKLIEGTHILCLWNGKDCGKDLP